MSDMPMWFPIVIVLLVMAVVAGGVIGHLWAKHDLGPFDG